MDISSMKLPPGLDKVLRIAARIVFAWWVVVGALGSLMSLAMGQFLVASIFAFGALAGVVGWRFMARPLQDGVIAIGRLRDKLEARINGTPYTDSSDTKKR